MVLSSQNCGKYVMGSWHRKRADAIVHPERYTEAELEWLEVTLADVRKELDPSYLMVETQPVDPLAKPRSYKIEEG